MGPLLLAGSGGVVLLHNSAGNPLGVLSKPTGVSQDGSVIVGGSVSGGGGGPAFEWANGVAAPIPQLASAQTSIADSVSADGSIIAGDIQTGSTISGFTLTGTNLEIIPPSSLNLTTRQNDHVRERSRRCRKYLERLWDANRVSVGKWRSGSIARLLRAETALPQPCRRMGPSWSARWVMVTAAIRNRTNGPMGW